ncbi:hypothetical protein [Sorangium sp. So ce1153]|uniref:hypothetical protein n=1 Tax=Sorangium sp. So ce1153 TaxID=3133333 RepID=UPI003F62F5FC
MVSMVSAATRVLPAVGIGLAALVLLGPGAQRLATGVRVWGAPVAGSEALALRIEGVRRLHGAEDPAALQDLEVSAASAGAPLERWTGSTGEDGIAEALLRAPGGLREPVVVRIARGGGALPLLEEQRVPLAPPLPATETSALPGAAQRSALPGAAHGELRLRVTAARGAMAAPFPERVRVAVETEDGAPAAGARVEASAVGADLEGQGGGPVEVAADARGAAELTLKPLAHAVELSLRATRPGSAPPGMRGSPGEGTWEGRMPVIPGAIWLDPGGLAGERPALRLVSPAPKPRAYVSIGGERGRLLGAVVPLAPDGAGFFAGALALPDGPALGAGSVEWAVVASDPYEQGAGTVAWPLSPAAGPAPPRRVALLADGLPAAEAREQARAWAARRAGLAVLGATAVAQMVLLALRSRAARRRLEAHLAAASTDEDGTAGAPLSREDRGRLLAAARAEPLLSVLALAALVGLSFAAVAALATFR